MTHSTERQLRRVSSRQNFTQFLFWLPLLALAGCGRSNETAAPRIEASQAQDASSALQGRLLLTGSSTMQPVMQAIAKRFQEQHPDVKIEIRTGGSLVGIHDARARTADIGMCSRALGDDEGDLFGFPIARDGVCLLVHKDNSLTNLSRAQVADIYTGKVKSWQEVGGRSAPIVAISRGVEHSEFELFAHYLQVKSDQIKCHVFAGDNAVAIKAVIDDPHAIAYVSLGESETNQAQGAAIKLLSVDGIAPTKRSMRTGTFPISRSLNLVTPEFPTGLVKAFVDFAMSSQVTDLIQACGYVPFQD